MSSSGIVIQVSFLLSGIGIHRDKNLHCKIVYKESEMNIIVKKAATESYQSEVSYLFCKVGSYWPLSLDLFLMGHGQSDSISSSICFLSWVGQ